VAQRSTRGRLSLPALVPEPSRSRLRAILTRRCPRCLEGALNQKIFEPNAACSECGLVFEREPGYFLGWFYVSYGIGAAVAIPTVLVAIYLDLPFGWFFPIVAIWVGLFGPLIVTYSLFPDMRHTTTS